MKTCKNGDGNPVKHPRTEECGKCYQNRWNRENRSPNRTGETTRVFPLETVGYHGAHKRVVAAKGKAAEWPCSAEGCTDQAQEWAYNGVSDQEQTGFLSYKGRLGQKAVTKVSWSPSPDDYAPLCRKHHGAQRNKWGVPDG